MVSPGQDRSATAWARRLCAGRCPRRVSCWHIVALRQPGSYVRSKWRPAPYRGKRLTNIADPATIGVTIAKQSLGPDSPESVLSQPCPMPQRLPKRHGSRSDGHVPGMGPAHNAISNHIASPRPQTQPRSGGLSSLGLAGITYACHAHSPPLAFICTFGLRRSGRCHPRMSRPVPTHLWKSAPWPCS